MDRHPQQIKRQRQDETRRARNMAHISALRTAVKKVLEAQDFASAEPLYKQAVKIIDKTASKGYIHKNTAARRKARISRYLNTLQSQSN